VIAYRSANNIAIWPSANARRWQFSGCAGGRAWSGTVVRQSQGPFWLGSSCAIALSDTAIPYPRCVRLPQAPYRATAPRVSLDSDSLVLFPRDPAQSGFSSFALSPFSLPPIVSHHPRLSIPFRDDQNPINQGAQSAPCPAKRIEGMRIPPPQEEPALRPRIPPLYMRPPSPPRNRFVPPRLAPDQQPAA
jgi:hypothetical protein